MRQTNPKRSVCHCQAYHFPHRVHSGLCAPGALDRAELAWRINNNAMPKEEEEKDYEPFC